MLTPLVLNAKNEPIILNEFETHQAKWLAGSLYNQYGSRCFNNSLGYEVAITTLTQISKRISEQKFYKLAPADYLPVLVGQAPWSSNITTYRSFSVADIFESGIVDLSGNNDRLSEADAAVDALNIKVYNWAKATAYSIFDLEQASKSGNWELASAKERSRKISWDLGIQKIAFIGAQGQNTGSSATCLGLLNQPGIKFDTALITQSLSSMSYSQLATFQQNAIQNYRANCNYTAYPSHFIIPESDFNGLMAQSSPQFPLKSVLQLLEEGFQVITHNKNFKILPNIYAQVSISGSGVLPSQAATQMYVFLNYDEESLKMEIPLDYFTTLANSINNFQFQSAALGQFTGVLTLRSLELYYAGF